MLAALEKNPPPRHKNRPIQSIINQLEWLPDRIEKSVRGSPAFGQDGKTVRPTGPRLRLKEPVPHAFLRVFAEIKMT
jgi:hypothetical protein